MNTLDFNHDIRVDFDSRCSVVFFIIIMHDLFMGEGAVGKRNAIKVNDSRLAILKRAT